MSRPQFAQAQTFSVLHSFTGLDGEHPYAGVTLDRAENLYGTTYGGGTGAGMVYKLTHQGSGWTFNSLSSFAGGGANPYAGVVFGPNGTLYGTTSEGGLHGGNGTVFNLSSLADRLQDRILPLDGNPALCFPGTSSTDMVPD